MYDLKVNDKICGFLVKRRENLPDVFATLYEMEYEKNGARLVFLDREDENKTFSVGFKTIPENSTGVFHIIEHSVLCGSKKFPVKEPFVELLKGSLNTFLNAITFPDKTVYPISTRNDKDYLNLSEVYLDAVFNPLMKENKSIFLQEGWRREINEDGELSYNGVVYNEMKGAYSSPDELGDTTALSMLFGESCYGFDSGGAPDKIPELSYEEYLASHAKYYHPSNAYFFIDGAVKLEEILSLISDYIKDYEKEAPTGEIPDVTEISTPEGECEFEISASESEENRGRLLLYYLGDRYDKTLDLAAFDIVLDAIAGTNEAPLKRAILDSGLCEKLSVYNGGSRLRSVISVEFQNIKDGSEGELIALFEGEVGKLVRDGINREHIVSAINHTEFAQRERDMGNLPLGIAYNISIFDTWLYGGDPAVPLSYTALFGELREKTSSDYYEKTLERLLLQNEKRVKLSLRPSASLGERREAAAREQFSKIKDSLTEEELEIIERESEALDVFQGGADSPEALATIPALEISDIPKELKPIPTRVGKACGALSVSHEIKTGGITYAEMMFDASDTAPEDIYLLPLFSQLLMNSATDKRDAYSMQNLIKRELGDLAVSHNVTKADGKAKLYIKLRASVLDGNRDALVEIIEEILYHATLDDKSTLEKLVRQSKLRLESGLSNAGDSFGFTRVLSYTDAEYALRERTAGYEYYKSISSLCRDFEKNADALIEKLRSFYKKIFVRERLTVSVSSAAVDSYDIALAECVRPQGKAVEYCEYEPLGAQSEAIEIPAQVGFASLASRLSDVGGKLTGSLLVARLILNYEYLWSEVRVKGGAYGVSCRVRQDGAIGFTSYRDPSSESSLDVFRGAAKFLRAFAESGVELTKYIIGAIGEFDPYASVSMKASAATANYISGFTFEDKCRIRTEILNTGKAELVAVADMLERFSLSASSVLVAPKATLDANKSLYKERLTL